METSRMVDDAKMKVVAFNGSPRPKGNTYNAIELVMEELSDQDIDVQIVQVGDKVLAGCLACGACAKTAMNAA